MHKTCLLFLSLLLSSSVFAQKIETMHPLIQENGDTIKEISKTAKFKETYIFLAKDKKTIYGGENLTKLKVIDIDEIFHHGLDTSKLKINAEQDSVVVKWKDAFIYFNSFLLVNGDIGLSGGFVTESYIDEEIMLPFHRDFILVFDTLLQFKAIRFVELPIMNPKPTIRNVFSVGIGSSSSELFAEVKYQEPTSAPVFIGLSTSRTNATPFPASFSLPMNNFRRSFAGPRFSYSFLNDDSIINLYSNGYEIVDMDNKSIFFACPDSTMILSPILLVDQQACVVVATIDMEKMKNSNFRYVSILDGSYVKDVDHKKLPSFYIHNLTGLSYAKEDPYLGFRIIEGKPYLVRFTP